MKKYFGWVVTAILLFSIIIKLYYDYKDDNEIKNYRATTKGEIIDFI